MCFCVKITSLWIIVLLVQNKLIRLMRKLLPSFLMTLCLGSLSFYRANSQCITPDVTKPGNQEWCSGSPTTPVNFIGTVPGTVFRWTNNNISIGLAATGTGNIASFTSKNTTGAPVTATVTVTPYGSTKAYSYIPNYNSDNVTVVDVATGTVVKTITVEDSPTGVIASPDGTKVYVANWIARTISVINTSTNTIESTISIPGAGVYGLAITPDGSKLYAPNLGVTMTVINTADNSIIKTISVPGGATEAVVSPDGKTVYTTGGHSSIPSNISVIDVATNTVTKTITVGTGASSSEGLTISPDGSRVYVTEAGANRVAVINTADNTVLTYVTVGTSPRGAAITPDGSKVYVANASSKTVSVINTADNSIKATIAVGINVPRAIDVSPDGSKVYVMHNATGNNVTIINTATEDVTTTFAAGSDPFPLGNTMVEVPSCPGNPQSFTIKVNPMPSASIAGTTSLCQGGPTMAVNLTGSGGVKPYTFAYKINGGAEQTVSTSGTSDVISLFPSTVAAGTFTYDLVSVKDASSSACLNTATGAAVITVKATPATPTISTSSSTTICAGGNVTLTSSAASGNQWYRNGSLISSAAGQTYAATTAGTYTVKVTESGCTSAESAGTTVVVNAVPSTPTVSTSGSTTICTSGSVTLTSSATSGNQWYNGTTLLTGQTGQTYIATTNGNYNVKVTTAGCTSATSATVAVSATGTAPVITSHPASQTMCAGLNATFNVAASGSGLSYQWKKDGAVISGVASSGLAIMGASPIHSGDYIVEVTNSCGTATSNIAKLVVNQNTAITTQPAPETVCVGGTASFDVIAAGSNLKYQWYKESAPISGATSATLSIPGVTTANAGNYSVVVTGDCGTKTSTSVALTVWETTSITTNPVSQIVCEGGSVSFTGSASGTGVSYKWLKDGTPISGVSGSTYSISTVTAAHAGEYKLEATSACGVATSIGATLTVNAIPATPTVSASGATTFCDGGSVTLTSSATAGNQWYNGTTLIMGAIDQTYTATASGNYNVKVATLGCASPASTPVSVTVNPAPATPTVTASGTLALCSGGSVTLTSSSTSGNQWYDGTTVITGATGQTYTATASGNYYVVVTNAGCTSAPSATHVVTVNAIPTTPAITAGGVTTFCDGGSVTLTSSAATGNQWYKDGASITGATGATYSATTSGNYTVISTQSGCPSLESAATVVTVNAAPAVPVITATGNILSSSATSGNQWFLNGTAITGATGQTHRVQASGLYTVKATLGSCEAISVAYNFVATRIDNPGTLNGEVSIYPNPVVKTLVVKNTAGRKLQVQLIDNFGKKVHESKVLGTQGYIDVQNLANGIYQVILTDVAKNETVTQTIVKL
jgi:YVTN family beta-propeller protein